MMTFSLHATPRITARRVAYREREGSLRKTSVFCVAKSAKRRLISHLASSEGVNFGVKRSVIIEGPEGGWVEV